MAPIEFRQDEMELLREILQRYLSEVVMEIAHSERRDFREFLGRRRDFMEECIRRLDRALEDKQKMVSVERIKKVEILQGLTEWELQTIALFFREETIPAEKTICEEGARADQLYILEQGSVSIRSTKLGRQEIKTPGMIVGWSFLVPPYRYTASAVTTSPSVFLVIKSPDFYYLIHKEPKMGVKVMDNLAQVVARRFAAADGLANR